MQSSPEYLSSLIAISDPAQRREGIDNLARLLGAEHCIIFIRDPDLDLLLPALGFSQTLPGRQEWRSFLDRCLEVDVCRAQLPYPLPQERAQAIGLGAADGSVLVLLGQNADVDKAAEVRQLLPLLAATLRQERVAQTAVQQGKAAREATAQLTTTATALETTRLALQKALQEADRANERMEHELAERKRVERALKRLNETLEARVQERTQQVRELVAQLTFAEQRERHRIVQVLHDDVQQMVVALQMSLHLIARQVDEDIRSRIEEMEQYAGDILEVTRTLVVELDSPARRSDNMTDAFTWLAQMMRERYQLKVDLDLELHWHLPNADARELLVNLTRELLFNVVKHADVERARLSVQQRDDAMVVAVEDDGAGFDVEAAMGQSGNGHYFGLFSVGERARLFGARLEIDSQPGRGTRAEIVVPAEVSIAH